MKQNQNSVRREAPSAAKGVPQGDDTLALPNISRDERLRLKAARPETAPEPIVVREISSELSGVRAIEIGTESNLRKGAPDPFSAPAEKTLRWIDISDPTPEIIERLIPHYRLDKQEVEDCLRVDDMTKLNRYGDHFFIVDALFQGMNPDKKLECRNTEVHFIMGEGYFITVHNGAIPMVEGLWSRVLKNHAGPEGARSSGDLYVLLMNEVLREQRKALEVVGHEALRFNTLLHHSRLAANDFADVSNISASLINIQGRISRTLETLQALRDEDDTVIDTEFRGGLYGRVVSHHQSLLRECRFQRDLIKEVRQHNDAVTIQHTNQITRRFAACSALTIPTVVYGALFGSNFTAIPYGSAPSLWGAVALTVAMTGGIAWYLRKNGWFR